MEKGGGGLVRKQYWRNFQVRRGFQCATVKQLPAGQPDLNVGLVDEDTKCADDNTIVWYHDH
jgi:stress response protein SCP2